MTKILKAVLQAGSAILALVAVSGTASAVTMKAVYTGTVYNSYDQTNDFGQGVGSVLDGLNYVLTFIYDPSTPGANRYTDSVQDQAYGGPAYGGATPGISTTLKIGGVTQTFNGANYYDYFYQYNDGSSYSSAYYTSQDYYYDGVNYSYNYVQDNFDDYTSGIPADLETPYSVATPINNYGYFQLVGYEYLTGNYAHYSYGYLQADHLTVSRVSAVPLPAALPLLISGLGVLGVATRRRKLTLS